MSGRKRWIWIAMTSLIQSANIPAPPCMLTTPSCTVQYLGAKDCDILQQDLTSLNTWSHESNLKFNASKCGVLTITWRKSPVIHEYHLGDVILQRVQEVKDLGVTISSNLSWDLHVMRIVLKTNRMLVLLKWTWPLITDIKFRRTLYLSVVKSQLSYATVVWSPASVKPRTILERV